MAQHQPQHRELQRRLAVPATVRRDAHDRGLAQLRVLAWAHAMGGQPRAHMDMGVHTAFTPCGCSLHPWGCSLHHVSLQHLGLQPPPNHISPQHMGLQPPTRGVAASSTRGCSGGGAPSSVPSPRRRCRSTSSGMCNVGSRSAGGTGGGRGLLAAWAATPGGTRRGAAWGVSAATDPTTGRGGTGIGRPVHGLVPRSAACFFIRFILRAST